jgi:hypothetical protein
MTNTCLFLARRLEKKTTLAVASAMAELYKNSSSVSQSGKWRKLHNEELHDLY